MLDIVFSASAAGSLLASNLSQSRRSHQIVVFELNLCVGDISELIPGPKRKSALMSLWGSDKVAAQVVRDILRDTQTSLRAVLHCAKKEESMRIWYSLCPDELCGLYWLMAMLKPFPNLKLTTVPLPFHSQQKDGTVAEYIGWGQVEPEEWVSLAFGREHPSPALRLAWAMKWDALRQENAPLRAVINHQLLSVDMGFYDPFLLQEIAKLPAEFKEVVLIGNTLGKYQLAVSSNFLACRIEALIQKGILALSTASPADNALYLYHRFLRKKHIT